MKRQLLLSSAITLASALAGSEESNEIQREQLERGGKPKPMLPFANKLLPHQNTRDLRAIGQRRGKTDKSATDDDDMKHHDTKHDDMKHDDMNHDDMNHDDMNHDDKHRGKSGKSTKSKGGKKEEANYNSKSGGKSSKKLEMEYTPYYMAPFPCTNMCIDADGADFNTAELNNAVQECSIDEMHGDTQQWILHTDNDLIQVESYAYKGKCIAVNYMPGDKLKEVQGSCEKGTLVLLPCHDPSSYWYFTGGQLLSFFCWSRGVSAAMSVSYDENKERCNKELKAYDAWSDKNMDQNKSRGETFMFITKEDMQLMYQPLPETSEVPTFIPTFFPTAIPTQSDLTDDSVPTPAPTTETERPTTEVPTVN